MIVTGVGGDDLALAAERAGVHLRKLRRVGDDEVLIEPAPIGTRFLLLRRNGKPNVRSHQFACRHAHERLFAEIFKIEPNAHIQTVLTIYRGLDDFLLRQPEVREKFERKFGREFYCECDRGERRAVSLLQRDLSGGS